MCSALIKKLQRVVGPLNDIEKFTLTQYISPKAT